MAAPRKNYAGTDHWDKEAPGLPTQLSVEQREHLQEFLKRCPKDDVEEMRFPAEPPEYMGCRVLRARKFVVDDALALVANTVKWRREKKVQHIAENDPYKILGCAEDELLFFYQKTYWPMPDKEGRPIYCEMGGVVDVDAMFVLLESDMERMVDYHIYGNEAHMIKRFTECSSRAGKPINQITTLFDMEGMTTGIISKTARNYIGAMIGIDKEHYPETLAKMYFINVPAFFSMGFAMIKPFLDERTVRKIEILSGPSEWKPRLLEHVGADNLPVQYGGNLVVPGGLYPPSRTKMTHVSPGKRFAETVSATAGQIIRFKWFCRPGDIRMSVTFHPGPMPAAAADEGQGASSALPSATSPGAVTVHKLQDHPDSQHKFVVITHTAPADGYYVACYDNQKGWRGRDVFHRWDLMIDGVPAVAAHVEQTNRSSVSAAGADAHAVAAEATAASGAAP